jgi:FMN phosphatase YigB (HAD superfamily)
MLDFPLHRIDEFKNLIFDLDNTIYPQEDFDRGAFTDIAQHFSLPKLLDYLMVERRSKGSVYRYLFNDMVASFGLPQSEVKVCIDMFRKHDGRFISADRSLVEILRILKNKKRIFVVTNGNYRTQITKIDALGLPEILHGWRICDGVSIAFKPDIASCISLFGGQLPASTLVIGDSLETDGGFARNIGARFLNYSFMGKAA